MTYSYVFRDHTADILFEVHANSSRDICKGAALALFETMVDPTSVAGTNTFQVHVDADTIEHLLFDFLSELIFIKDAEAVIFKDLSVKILETGDGLELEAEITGDHIDLPKHDLKVDVKAVTLHLFKVEEKDGLWNATVLLDI